MDLYLFVLTAMVVLAADCDATERCPASTGMTFNLLVASRRNLTGHWRISMNAVAEDASKPREIQLELGQSTASCGVSERLQLTTQATLDVLNEQSDSNNSEVLPAVTTAPPPAGYEVINGLGYYKMYTNALAWKDAKDKCEHEGAHLIVINSDEEAEVVKTFFARKPNIRNATFTSYAHIGFHDQVTEGQFLTVLGEPLASSGYMRWYGGDPDGGSTQNCGSATSDGKLIDNKCDNRCFFICEYNDQ